MARATSAEDEKALAAYLAEVKAAIHGLPGWKLESAALSRM